MARTGSEIGVAPKEDWTVFGLRTTKTELDSSWAIFADRLMRPNIDTSDVEFIRDQLVTGIRQRADSPDATLDYLADSITFAGSPFALDPVGSSSEELGRMVREGHERMGALIRKIGLQPQ